MFKISLMDHLDLEDAYKIELETNPSPWSKDNFLSSFEVGHKSLVCKHDDDVAKVASVWGLALGS